MLVYFKTCLFLLGTTLASGRMLRNRIPSRSWNPTANRILMSPKLSYLPSPPIEPMDFSAGSSSLLSNYWPLNTNQFYDSRIMMQSNGVLISNEVHQKECDDFKESITFSADKTFIRNSLEPTEIKSAPEKTEQSPVPIMVEELPQHSPITEIMDHKMPLEIPQAPELPPLHMPEIPAFSPMVVAPLSEPKTLEIPYISEFKPFDIPKVPELSSFVVPDIPTLIKEIPCPNPEKTNSLPKYEPVYISEPPQIPHIIVSDVSKPTEIQSEPAYEPSLFAPIRPEDDEKKSVKIPTAPKLLPFPLSELPAPMQTIPSHSITLPKQSKEVETISEFRPLNTNSAPQFTSLYLPEPPFISSNSPMKSTERQEPIINAKLKPINELPLVAEAPTPIEVTVIPSYNSEQIYPPLEFPPEYKPVNLPAIPELSPLYMPELPAPIEISSYIIKDLSTPQFGPQKVNIPAVPELPFLPTPEQPGPIEILKETSTPRMKPLNIPTIPQLPPVATESICVETHVPESPEEDMKPFIIPQAPELPPHIISALPPTAHAAPLIEENSVQVSKHHPLPSFPELPPFLTHKMEPIIVATTNSEKPCNKDETIEPTFISQGLQRPMMYPVFLAQNIIIERVVPNLYLSHKPYTVKPEFPIHSHLVFLNGNFESQM